MNKCMYEPMNGRFPVCDDDDKCKFCPYYYVDKVCTTIKEWMEEAKVEEPCLTKYDYDKKKLIIYTTRPGYLIGFHGKLVEKYAPKLNEILRFHFIDKKECQQNSNLFELVECNDYIV